MGVKGAINLGIYGGIPAVFAMIGAVTLYYTNRRASRAPIEVERAKELLRVQKEKDDAEIVILEERVRGLRARAVEAQRKHDSLGE